MIKVNLINAIKCLFADSTYPPGHFYSPIPSKDDVSKREQSIFGTPVKNIDGIDFNEDSQLKLLAEIQQYYKAFPYTDRPDDKQRYCLDNDYYYGSDAMFLYCLMRHFKPGNIVEIGSGYSSALMLDINEHLFENKTRFCFIDPNPERLFSRLKPNDRVDNKFVLECTQDVDFSVFEELKQNDILFIDSSHVSKVGSDVNFILFEILPRLRKGVLIHFHDIFYPFVYPKQWILKGRAWNEVFILRAFLQYNAAFEIILFNTFLETSHTQWFNDNMPLCLKQSSKEFSHSGSIWLRKT